MQLSANLHGSSVYLRGRSAAGFGVGASPTNELASGQPLRSGQSLLTKNGGRLVLQGDGNLVLYGPDKNALWASGTNGRPVSIVTMQSDGNLVAYDTKNHAYWDTHTQGNPGAHAVFQDDGNLVVYSKDNRALWNSRTNGWKKPPASKSVLATIVKAAGAPITAPVQAIAKVTSKIPVVGDVTRIVSNAASAPANIANSIASGTRLDHVAVSAFKDQLKLIHDVAPYAQMVVSFVPGIGTGVSAAIGAGAALAEGRSINEAVKAGIRGILPGGPIAAAAFDTAMKVAAGESLSQAALEGARGLLPPGAAQSAFDIGLAVVTGQKIQTALAKGLANIAGAQLETVLAAGESALSKLPDLSAALKSLPAGSAEQGFKVAAGLLSHKGINEQMLSTVRSQLPPDVVQGFDAALKSQIPHIAWLKNVVNSPVIANAASAASQALKQIAKLSPEDQKKLVDFAKSQSSVPATTAKPVAPKVSSTKPAMHAAPAKAPAPSAAAKPVVHIAPTKPVMRAAPVQPSAPPKPLILTPPVLKRAPITATPAVVTPVAPTPTQGAYAPYPQVGVSGPTWSPAIRDMPREMSWAGRSAVHGSRGRPRKVLGPDGHTYLFAIENGSLVARQAVG